MDVKPSLSPNQNPMGVVPSLSLNQNPMDVIPSMCLSQSPNQKGGTRGRHKNLMDVLPSLSPNQNLMGVIQSLSQNPTDVISSLSLNQNTMDGIPGLSPNQEEGPKSRHKQTLLGVLPSPSLNQNLMDVIPRLYLSLSPNQNPKDAISSLSPNQLKTVLKKNVHRLRLTSIADTSSHANAHSPKHKATPNVMHLVHPDPFSAKT